MCSDMLMILGKSKLSVLNVLLGTLNQLVYNDSLYTKTVNSSMQSNSNSYNEILGRC
jgi:hypothetical protein